VVCVFGAAVSGGAGGGLCGGSGLWVLLCGPGAGAVCRGWLAGFAGRVAPEVRLAISGLTVGVRPEESGAR
jgi:hypothetical protein